MSQLSEIQKLARETCQPSKFLSAVEFFNALYNQTKRQARAAGSHYSTQLFNKDLGLGQTTTIWLIMRSKRRVTEKSLRQIQEALKLPESEAKFLDGLVQLSYQTDESKREEIHRQLLAIKSELTESEDERRMILFFSEWYHGPVYEIVGLDSFRNESRWIAARLRWRITPAQARESLSLLEKIGLIEAVSNGSTEGRGKTYQKTGITLQMPARSGSLWLMNYHKKMMSLAQDSFDYNLPSEREIASLTGAVTNQGMREILDEVRRFRKYIRFLIESNKGGDQIVQANIQCFPLLQDDEK